MLRDREISDGVVVNRNEKASVSESDEDEDEDDGTGRPSTAAEELTSLPRSSLLCQCAATIANQHQHCTHNSVVNIVRTFHS